VLGCLGVVAYLLTSEGGGKPKQRAGRVAPSEHHLVRAGVQKNQSVELRVIGSDPLPAAVQDGAGVVAGGDRVVLLGGLTASDVSTDGILFVGLHGGKRHGTIKTAVHDAAAVRIGGEIYLFGGGDAVRQHEEIVRVNPLTGTSSVAGHLPAPSSDHAAAAIGGTAFVVGGYTGTRWLDTIVAWRPHGAAHVVGHLPTPIRYAAVTALDGRLLIAGGSLPNGSASKSVFEFFPHSRRIRRIGFLPAPTTHAATAAIGNTAFVIGGRGASVGTPVSRIVSISSSGRFRLAGRLPQPLSDLAAVAVGGRIVIVGGRGTRGAVATTTWFRPVAHSVPAAPRRASAPARTSSTNVYAADRPGDLQGAARFARALIYVPNSQSDTVDVIDPGTFKIVGHFAVGGLPQHVVPAYDLRTLYVTNDTGNSLTVINPRTGRPGRTIPVADPYNMYFTPDGRFAIVVAERLGRLDFRDAHSFRLRHSLTVPCRGVDHMDFSADGSFLLASCEFSSQLVKVDVRRQRVVGTLRLPPGASPQDVKLSPDGSVFYVADKAVGGVWEIDGAPLRRLGFLRTGFGAHGLYVSRDARYLYVTNRAAGSISVASFATRHVVATWRIPGGGSPDMGGVSTDGKVLWLSGRYNAQVYAISTRDGKLLARINVGLGPHGLCVWPQPGRYSLGHTGILR
jgi:DNA-binding beta-propeller fold protein YncE/N-acetylneuraminic acid mutarotase